MGVHVAARSHADHESGGTLGGLSGATRSADSLATPKRIAGDECEFELLTGNAFPLSTNGDPFKNLSVTRP